MDSNTTGGTLGQITFTGNTNYVNWDYPYHHYYHPWHMTITEKSKAFKVAKVLRDKGIVQVDTVEKFIELVDALEEMWSL